MLLNHFGLKDDPFGVTPDCRYFFETQGHREALASLTYGISVGRGFLALIAQPGMGKTSILNKLLQDTGQNARTAYLFQTQCNSREFLEYLLSDLEVADAGRDVVTMHRRLNEVLLQEANAGKKCVVVIDEAQNLDHEVLETVRLLSDFETRDRKLLQIVLAGQPALAEKLTEVRQEQLRQRISSISWLTPLMNNEVPGYIDYRLRTAGYRGPRLFTPDAEALIASGSKGIPRSINNICFNALSICCAEGSRQVEPRMVEEVLRDLNLQEPTPERTTQGAEKARTWPTGSPAQSTLNAAGWGNLHTSTSANSAAGAAFSRQATAPKLTPEPEFARTPQPQPIKPAAPRPRLVTSAPPAKQTSFNRKGDVRRTFAVSLISACAALAGIGVFAAWQASRDSKSTTVSGPTTSSSDLNDASPQLNPPKPDQEVSANSTFEEPAQTRESRSKTSFDDSGTSNTSVRKRAELEPSMGSFTQRPQESSTIDPPHLSAPVAKLSGSSPLTSPPAMPTYRPVPRPPAPAREPEEPGLLLKKVTPSYPQAAQSAHVSGVVELEAVVGRDGTVKKVKVLSGHVMLRQAAADAVRRWRYQPYRVDGVPTEFATHVTVKFTLANEPS